MTRLFLIALVVVGCNQSTDSVTLKDREIERQELTQDVDISNKEERVRFMRKCQDVREALMKGEM